MDDAARPVRHRGLEDLHDDPDRRALLLRRPRPVAGPRSARSSSTTSARSGRRSSAPTRASRRSSGRPPSWPTPATSAPPRPATRTSRFVVYHSGFEPAAWAASGPTTPTTPTPQGVDRLIRSLQDNERRARTRTSTPSWAAPGGSSCATPTAAAHVLGKLLKHVGEDRVVWGTDSIWFGTPQDQIQAMRDVPDHPRVPGALRLPGADRRAEGQDLRADLGRAVRHRGPRVGRARSAPPTSRRSGPTCPRPGPTARRPSPRRRPSSPPTRPATSCRPERPGSPSWHPAGLVDHCVPSCN